MSSNIVIEKEMGLSHKEFFRTIASAFGTTDFERWATGVRLITRERVFEVRLGVQGERRIAMMVVPKTMVTLEFTNYDQAQAQAAVKRFDMMFKRGGG